MLFVQYKIFGEIKTILYGRKCDRQIKKLNKISMLKSEVFSPKFSSFHKVPKNVKKIF